MRIGAGCRIGDRDTWSAVEDEVTLGAPVQRTVINSLLDSREPLGVRIHAVATESSHVHTLVSWRTERTWRSIARSLRRSMSLRLNSEHGRRTWFSEGRSRKRVREESHFEHLVETYLPSHRGWYWSEHIGWREPLADESDDR